MLLWDSWRAAALLGTSLRGALARHQQLAPWLEPQGGWGAGLLGCWRWTRRALTTSRRLERELTENHVELVYANDLAAGLVLALIQCRPGLRRVYDSHELQIHRHRRAGWLRILIEQAQERSVLKVAQDIVTVNPAVARAMFRIHPGLPSPPRTVLNDFYAHRDVAIPPADATPALLYVGGGTRGRRIERLFGTPEQMGFEVHGWLLGGVPPDSLRGRFHRSDGHYEQELLAIMQERRCLMWCGLETQALNNRLATPNKFFQAMALGLPIVASPGTYLAELVQRHGIGAIDQGELRDIAREVASERYVRWVQSVVRFRQALRHKPESVL